jgi:hypothetical protein
LKPASGARDQADSRRRSAFQIFKYSIYVILLIDVFFYIAEDFNAYLYLDEGVTFAEVLESFGASIDAMVWMILILLFEVETSARARDVLHGVRKRTIAGLTAVCYGFLIYAAYSYVLNLVGTYHFEPIAAETVCELVDDHFAYSGTDARPIELTAENCGAFSGEQVYRSPSDHLIATHANLVAMQDLAWVDVANASAWLLVVFIFQIEIYLEQIGKLTRAWLAFCTATKIVLYLMLAADAIYWTIYSAFIDSWDAWLWLVAFVLIDLNLLGLDEAAD